MAKVLELLQNKKVKITLISILVVLFVIIMLGYISKGKDKQETPVQQEPQKIEITDELKATIETYISELSYGTYCTIPTNKEFANDCLFRNGTTLQENLTLDYRLSSLILSIGARKEHNILVGTVVVENVKFVNPYYVPLKEVEEEYHRLYGKDDAFTPASVNLVGKYKIKYDKELSRFIYEIEPGELYTITYLSKMDSTIEEVYAYVKLGYIEHKYYKYYLYSDKELKENIGSYTSVEYKNGGLINKENEQQFSEYKFTFVKEKDTNNLVFKQVNKIT